MIPAGHDRLQRMKERLYHRTLNTLVLVRSIVQYRSITLQWHLV